MKAIRPMRVTGRGATPKAGDSEAVHRLLAAAHGRGRGRVAKADLTLERVEAKLEAIRAGLPKRGTRGDRP
jgi:hypothetical protein